MSARIVLHANHEPMDPSYFEEFAELWRAPDRNRGDLGQLWERVVERSERTYRHVWRGGMTRGPLFIDNRTSMVGHGIIRAGERVR